MTGRRDRIQSHAAPERGQQETFVIARTVEVVIPDDAPDPKPNRAERRAAARKGRQKATDGRETQLPGPIRTQEAREGPCTPVSGPKSPRAARFPQGPQNGAQSLNPAPPTRTETP